MGQLRLLLSRPEQSPHDAAQWAHMAGIDGIPWRSRNRLVDDTLVIERETDESGNVFVPWITQSGETVVLSTATLMERERPYQLPVELARGLIQRWRQHHAVWRQNEMLDDDAGESDAAEAMEWLLQAATIQNDPAVAADLASRSIESGLKAIERLMRSYSSIAVRRRCAGDEKLPTMLAANIGISELTSEERQGVTKAFNSADVPISWRRLEPNNGEYDWNSLDAQIEWTRGIGLRVCAGPLLRLDKRSLPDWLYLWEDDYEQLESCVASFVAAIVGRYRGKMHAWHCMAGMNDGDPLSLSDEERLRLAVVAIDAARRTDSKTPIIVNFDQPWGEYLAREDHELSPLHFADALVRAELGISGLGLEFHLGYSPGGTLPRDVLEVSDEIDRWLGFGLPLLVNLTIPSSNEPAGQATRTVWPAAAETPVEAMPGGDRAVRRKRITPEDQAELASRILEVLLAKPGVHGVIWSQLNDAGPIDSAHGGLFDEKKRAKPIVKRFAEMRNAYLY